jgi:hypothetical protein
MHAIPVSGTIPAEGAIYQSDAALGNRHWAIWAIAAGKLGNAADAAAGSSRHLLQRSPHLRGAHAKDTKMPRYIVERNFPEGLLVPIDDNGAAAMLGVVDRNLEKGVTWVQSFVSPDKKSSYCVYDGPSPEAIRSAAQKNAIPADKITEVRVLDPYFYR